MKQIERLDRRRYASLAMYAAALVCGVVMVVFGYIDQVPVWLSRGVLAAGVLLFAAALCENIRVDVKIKTDPAAASALNNELVTIHRLRSTRIGFWAMIATAWSLRYFDWWMPEPDLSSQNAGLLVIIVGAGAYLLSMLWFMRR